MKDSYANIKKAVSRYRNILIYIKGSPDPDAIASSFAFKCLCSMFNVNSTIVATTILSLQENREFVRLTDIPIQFEKAINDIDGYDAYAVLDHQSAHVDRLTGRIPCAVHIDHHEAVEDDIPADFRLIDLDAGSTSTLMTLIFREFNFQFKPSEMKVIATSLLFGIRTDTDKLMHACEIDHIAVSYLMEHADTGIIENLERISLSKISVEYLSLAIENQFIYKDWVITGIGFIDEKNRDTIAVIADYLLEKENYSTVIVFAAIVKSSRRLVLDASFRTNNENMDLNAIIKEITEQGGGRKYKGAFQVNLDFFSYCPDKKLLWELIRLTAIEALTKRRDKIYVTEIKGFYNMLKHKISSILDNK